MSDPDLTPVEEAPTTTEDMPAKYDMNGQNGDESKFVNPVYLNSTTDLSKPSTNGNSPPPAYDAIDDMPKARQGSANGVNGTAVSGKDVQISEDGEEGDKKKKKEEEPKTVGIGATFRFATGKDKFMMLLGTICGAAHGAALPVMIIVFGNMSDLFIESGMLSNLLDVWIPVWVERCQNLTLNCENVTKDYLMEDPNPPARFNQLCDQLNDPIGCDTDMEPIDLMKQMSGYAINFTIIGCCVLVVAYFQVMGWQTAAFNQSNRIRQRLFWSIMRQEIGWFDTHEVGELNTRMSDDTAKIEAGIGEKLGLFCQWVSAFIAGIVIGFVYSWKLTLVILAVSPLLALAGGAMGKLGSSMTSKELSAYAKAGAVAEEVFGAIRTVVAFGGEEKECQRYENNLTEARDFGIKKGLVNGVAMGLVFLVMFCSYGLAFWYGSKLVYEDGLSPGSLMIVFFCVLIGTFSLGNAAPNIQDFANARGAAYAIWGVIDNIPHIDSSSDAGTKDEAIAGNVEFRNIHFNYPSRPDVKVLQGLSMKIAVGQTVALVGPSGCGKSTTVQLLQRFYDPEVGEVLIDGIDIRERNVQWLRQHIGVVSQEPVLFDTTIAENIRYGQDGVTTDDIIRASKEANAHDFITKLPKQYDTLVGGRGAQLSGGQKQRIAIARALVRNPKILLLDEATSALDTESEATVQGALDKARMGRTTLVIAHRLSTVRTADSIVSVEEGVVTELGTHDELMAKQGLYYALVMNQQTEDEDVDIIDSDKPELIRALSHRVSGKLKRGMSTVSHGSELHRAESTVEEKLPDPGMGRIMQMNKPEMPLLIGGCFCALVVGAVQPAFAIVFAEILGVYAMPEEEARPKVNLYSGLFPIIGVVSFLGMTGMSLCFSRSGEHLTMRMRKVTFSTMLRREIAYFDDHNNSVGALCTRLATDASAVQGATGSRLGMFCQSLSSIGVGIVIGFVFSWELTLLIIAFVPFVLASGFIQMKVLSGNTKDKKEAFEQAGKIAIEGIENIRTVATLTKEAKFHQDYCDAISEPHRQNLKGGHIQGIAYGFSQCVLFFAYAGCFYLGAYLIENKGLAFDDMFKVFSAIVFGAMAAGQASSFAPDYGKAKGSAAKIFNLIDTKSPIDHMDTSGDVVSDCRGSVEFKNVAFKYPTRPNVTVLQGMDLTVQPGQTIALVGSSGCGKSTSVQLLERFYDPLEGDVCIEGRSLKELNLKWVRNQTGLVSQEPILFDTSIRENIAYGDNTRDVPMAEIIEAARNANIHSFIETLPEGYDSNVGDKGAQLSGGQKQRIAIARALVRNPKILLLDEATSALDTESEKVVQAALDKAQEGRTCIVIAHRLSTIQNADCILVIHQGHVVEMGTHSELIQQRGRYYKLNNAQLTRN